MKVPGHDVAEIPKAKIVEYLLSETHRVGRHKAAFFIAFGFERDAWEQLCEALRWHASEHDLVESVETEYGTRYAVEGIIRTPDGRNPPIRSIWFIDAGESIPRFVTAYPL